MENTSESSGFINNWKDALKIPLFRRHVFFTFAATLFLAFFIHRFFEYIQARSGYILNDPVLNLFTPVDTSAFIFTIMYIAILASLANIMRNPFLFIKGLQAFCMLSFMRICMLYFVPLEPDVSIIPLRDPVVDYLFYNQVLITKDLFFSGHVSTMFLLFLFVRGKQLKAFVFIVTLIVAGLILLQHSHYTIDVVAAPLFAYLSFRLADYVAPAEQLREMQVTTITQE